MTVKIYGGSLHIDQCKAAVYDHWHTRQCYRAATREGWCYQHHPEAVAKRDTETQQRQHERYLHSPGHLAASRLVTIERLQAMMHRTAKSLKENVLPWVSTSYVRGEVKLAIGSLNDSADV